METLRSLLMKVGRDRDLGTSLRTIYIYTSDMRFIDQINIPYALSTHDAVSDYVKKLLIDKSSLVDAVIKEFGRRKTHRFFTQGKILSTQYVYEITVNGGIGKYRKGDLR